MLRPANPIESFNGKLKIDWTDRQDKSINSFCLLCIDGLIPYHSLNDREFLFYRVPGKECEKIANLLETARFKKVGDKIVHFRGFQHIQVINFEFNSCSCRWYNAYAMCAHLVAACNLFNQQLTGFKAPKHFVYRKKRGAHKKGTANNAAMYLESFNNYPPAPIAILPEPGPTIIVAETPEPPTQAIEATHAIEPSQSIEATQSIESTESFEAIQHIEATQSTQRLKRKYTKRKLTEPLTEPTVKRPRGRPPKVASALNE